KITIMGLLLNKMTETNLTLLVGISGSGKTTLAHKLWEEDPKNTVIVSRDKIRELLFSYTESNIIDYYGRKDIQSLENKVSEYLHHLIVIGLNGNKKVIVDNTHLKLSYLEHYHKYNVPTRLIILNQDLEFCLDNDSQRERKVGKEVIKKQFNQYKTLMNDLVLHKIFMDNSYKGVTIYKNYEFKTKVDKKIIQNDLLPKAIICDIDGCLAKMSDRSPYEWNKVGNDEVQDHIKNIVNFYYENNYKVFIFTGRDGSCFELTEQWLKDNNVKFDYLFSRKEKDQRKDSIIKEELFRENVLDNYYVEMVIDDRMQVIRMWNNLGLTVLSNNSLAKEF
ncbi:MAG: AAA family ATPase, partial [Romboutsia sp.]|nr:AAA family ATPase [Romboutsia sp.]